MKLIIHLLHVISDTWQPKDCFKDNKIVEKFQSNNYQNNIMH